MVAVNIVLLFSAKCLSPEPPLCWKFDELQLRPLSGQPFSLELLEQCSSKIYSLSNGCGSCLMDFAETIYDEKRSTPENNILVFIIGSDWAMIEHFIQNEKSLSQNCLRFKVQNESYYFRTSNYLKREGFQVISLNELGCITDIESL